MAAAMTTYRVTYRRDTDDDAWLVDIDGLDDVHTFGRTLEEAAVNAREAIAVTVDVEPDDVDLDEHVDVAGADIEELLRLREQADQLHDAYLRRQRDVARRLADAGVSRRDSARLLGVSHQRVQQLVAG
jgi:predicted RNase H-like HicB family nuclease